MISWLLRLYWNRPDAAWKPTGIRYTTERSYDEAKAVKAMKKAKQRSETGRRYLRGKKVSPAPDARLRRVK